ncbi:ATP-grasp domain-containing protein [Ornithinimicrobium sp. W1679]|uniref:ATP-grasp domain-containing protein n=1 Tax=Ornithinimicrobium sp. W1679 TaxID=3418770 RepID=UPI003CEE80F2
MTFLLTSVGRRVELVRHFQAYERREPGRLRVLGTEIDKFAPAAQELGSALRQLPRVDDPDYATAMVRLCADEGIDAIFPLIDPDVEALARMDVPVAALSAPAAETVSDKWLTFKWLQAREIPTVNTWLPSDAGATPRNYPVFMKPRRGSGGKDAFPVRNRHEYDFFRHYIDAPVAQEFLPGKEITADAVVGSKGAILAIALRERLAVRGGEVSRGRLIVDHDVEEKVRQVVRDLEPSGPITVQGMYDESGVFRVTEINGRMGGGLPLAIEGGLALAQSLTSSWLGEQVTPRGPCDLSPGMHMARFDQSVFWRVL